MHPRVVISDKKKAMPHWRVKPEVKFNGNLRPKTAEEILGTFNSYTPYQISLVLHRKRTNEAEDHVYELLKALYREKARFKWHFGISTIFEMERFNIKKNKKLKAQLRK